MIAQFDEAALNLHALREALLVRKQERLIEAAAEEGTASRAGQG